MAIQGAIHIDWTWTKESLGSPITLGSLRANTGDGRVREGMLEVPGTNFWLISTAMAFRVGWRLRIE
jgi:hypothetical protein